MKEKMKMKGKEKKSTKTKNWVIGTSVVAAISVAVIILTGGIGLLNSGSPSTADGEVIKIPLSEISETAKWYEHKSWKIIVRFFAVKAEDGSIKTGFDACDICYSTREGYSQQGLFMVCNNCGNKYPITGLGTENKIPGGCWPGYLPSYVDGEYLIIKESDLDKGRRLFA